MSFRARLTLTAMVTLAVGLGALLVAGNVLIARRVSAESSSLLRAKAEAEIAALSVSERGVTVRETTNDALLDRRSWVIEGDKVIERPPSISAALDRRAVALGRTHRSAEVGGPGSTRLLARPLRPSSSQAPVGSVVVAVSVASLERLEREVVIGSLVFAALMLLAGWLAIRSALNGALRPVAQMTASAEDWGAHDLDRRFDLGSPRDELTGLAATLDHLLARIASSRRHEQRFAEDVAHELRNPLARIRGRAELALQASGAQGDGERSDALRAVVAETEDVDRAVNALLGVARREVSGAGAGVDLQAVAQSFPEVRVLAPTTLPLAEGDPEIARRALAPLVENALRHRRRTVTIELSAGGGRVRAAVRDDGPGLDPRLGERAFEPGVRGDGEPDGGAGLGLPLARRLARACGGDVVIGPAGDCFVLDLPQLALADHG